MGQRAAGSLDHFHPGEDQQDHETSVVYCQPKPIPAGVRIPQSQSCGSVLGLLSPVSSRCADSVRPFSPASSLSGHLTEPRSYAPRTPGQQGDSSDPPPKFDPSGIVNGQQQQMEEQLQTYGVPKNHALAGAYPGSEASSPAAMPVMNAAGASRSTELMNLTNTPTGMPLLATAMAPSNFPFIEAPRMANSFNHGVVKLKNVSQLRGPARKDGC